jgi:hypothetical protein
MAASKTVLATAKDVLRNVNSATSSNVYHAKTIQNRCHKARFANVSMGTNKMMKAIAKNAPKRASHAE